MYTTSINLLAAHTKFMKKLKCNKFNVIYLKSGLSLKERLLYTLNKLFVIQVKSFLLLLDLYPFISLSSSHNIKYIKFTSP